MADVEASMVFEMILKSDWSKIVTGEQIELNDSNWKPTYACMKNCYAGAIPTFNNQLFLKVSHLGES